MPEDRDSRTLSRRDFVAGSVAVAAVARAAASAAPLQATGASSMIELPKLPWGESDLAPHISQETVSFHYGKHHKAYVDNTNRMITGTELATASLEDIVKATAGKPDKKGLFNNSAQVWNHSFYWNCMAPNAGGEPTGPLAEAIARQFGSFLQFKEKFTAAAVSTFGSGWAWLVRDGEGKLAVESTSNAGNPLREGKTPLLTCDVWEHAYYIDYRNARPAYVDAFWKLVNWRFVQSR
jgi:Fe-Mn family superoxide dismutase